LRKKMLKVEHGSGGGRGAGVQEPRSHYTP
jgi:hypothetical protein